jgi:hypothetical protein
MKRVYIIGSGDSGEGFGSFPFEDGEIWGVNNLFILHPNIHWTRIFEVHSFSLKPPNTWLRKGEESWRNLSINDYIFQLDSSGIPIYTLPHPECPFKNPVIIDLKALQVFRNFFSTTISYELALAILEGFTDIHLIGIDMVLSSEYRDQRPSVTYFIGLAEGRGITVTISKGSPIVENDYLYGLGVSKFTLWDRRITAMRTYMDSEIAKHNSLIDQYKGAKNCLVNVEEFYTLLLQGGSR